jgi:hypothetical protein
MDTGKNHSAGNRNSRTSDRPQDLSQPIEIAKKYALDNSRYSHCALGFRPIDSRRRRTDSRTLGRGRHCDYPQPGPSRPSRLTD